MRVLLSTIGSRGEVQPVLALALRLRSLGQEVRLCAPPDFRELIAGYDLPFVPIGPEVRHFGRGGAKPTPAELRSRIPDTVATQFEFIAPAADDCDIVLGCGALQIAARSLAEQRGIPYVYAAYSPNTLPNPQLAPPPMPGPPPATTDVPTLWEQDAQRWNQIWSGPLNSQRAALGLPPVADVRGYIFTESPWLAADPILGPWPQPAALPVLQTGAWLVPDDRPLAAELDAFLEAGAPPIYFGFGSMHVAPEIGRTLIETARKLGYRAVVQRGWTDLSPIDDASDCLAIGEVNQQALFPRVVAVVHHGGAGTTTAIAKSGVPQVVIPQRYDQPYWASRAEALGIGVALPLGEPATDSLVAALDRALAADTVARAGSLTTEIRTDGTEVAARHLLG
ncbi:glycosyltransferase [Nocardia sp. NPDC006630]|uniref:glycosyltransferase n=1 Tax=Nocardia sp. NPDC006630 TaxID=3157181 RepID=UPI0033B86257